MNENKMIAAILTVALRSNRKVGHRENGSELVVEDYEKVLEELTHEKPTEPTDADREAHRKHIEEISKKVG